MALQKALFYIFLLLLFLLPFELPINEGVHGVFRHFIGEFHPIFFVGILLLIVTAMLLFISKFKAIVFTRNNMQNYVMLSIIYVFVGLFAVALTAVHDGRVDLAIKQFFLGYFSPVVVCFYILLLDENNRRKAWLTLYMGWVAYLAGSIILLVYYWNVGIEMAAGFGNAPFGQKLFLWRYTMMGDWNSYPTYIGNANKTSNYILIFLLLSARLLREDHIRNSKFTKETFLIFWSLGIVTLIVLFSRATLLLLPFIIYISGVLNFIHKRTKRCIAAVLILSIVVASSVYYDAINFLFFWKTSLDADSNPLGSMGGRFYQWQDSFEYLTNHFETLLFGLGTGSYAKVLLSEDDPMLGTHNMFLDVLMEAGLVGLFSLITLVFLMVFQTFKNNFIIRDRLAIVAIFTLVMLMSREHSVAYLYATSLGGFCFVLIFYILNHKNVVGLNTNTQVNITQG